MSESIKKLTTSGIICALSIVVLITGLFPGLIYFSINISIGTLTVIGKQYGTKQWIACYIATSLLSIFIVPDLELSLTYICMGWYPLVRNYANKLSVIPRKLVKVVVSVLASVGIYYISIAVFGTDEIMEKIPFFIVFYVLTFSMIFGLLELMLALFDRAIGKKIQKALRSSNLID